MSGQRPRTQGRLREAALRIPNWFITTPARYIALVVTTFLSQWTLFRADAVFEGIAGFPTLDTQNDLTREEATAQIRSYSARAVEAYELFAVIDYLFPLAGGLLVCANILWLLRVSNRVTRWTVPEWVALVGLLPVAADYVENVFLAIAVATAGNETALTVALAAKSVKLATIVATSALQAVALLYAVTVRIVRRARRASWGESTPPVHDGQTRRTSSPATP